MSNKAVFVPPSLRDYQPPELPYLPEDAEAIQEGDLGHLSRQWLARAREAGQQQARSQRLRAELAAASDAIYHWTPPADLDSLDVEEWNRLARCLVKERLLSGVVNRLDGNPSNLAGDAEEVRSRWQAAQARYYELRAYVRGEEQRIPQVAGRAMTEMEVALELKSLCGIWIGEQE